MSAPTATAGSTEGVDIWRSAVMARLQSGARFAGMYASAADNGTALFTILSAPRAFDTIAILLYPESGAIRFPSLSPDVPAAAWYERALHDLSGVFPVGHPRLDPLLLPLEEDAPRPQPGLGAPGPALRPAERGGPVDVSGHGMFSIPFGPVRSGVFETVEFLVETPGEDIVRVNVRPHYKHRGIAKSFEGHTIGDGVLVAERVEGIASVAHALAYSHAVESPAGVQVPRRAQLIRVIHAELERIANHLDVAMRLCDAAGLAVGTSRFGWHKEEVMRLVSPLCGNRFGRAVVIPGGVGHDLGLAPDDIVRRLGVIRRRIAADRTTLMDTSSFLDRIRGTGRLPAERAREMGALGPIGRASGYDDDDRRHRPYDAYAELGLPATPERAAGDALARLNVRWDEIDGAANLITGAAQCLRDAGEELAVPVPDADGFSLGWAEAPQGEVLYGIELADGVIRRCFARSASFHNLPLFPEVFRGDVQTDFAFIEASFGLSYAGVAM